MQFTPNLPNRYVYVVILLKDELRLESIFFYGLMKYDLDKCDSVRPKIFYGWRKILIKDNCDCNNTGRQSST